MTDTPDPDAVPVPDEGARRRRRALFLRTGAVVLATAAIIPVALLVDGDDELRGLVRPMEGWTGVITLPQPPGAADAAGRGGAADVTTATGGDTRPTPTTRRPGGRSTTTPAAPGAPVTSGSPGASTPAPGGSLVAAIRPGRGVAGAGVAPVSADGTVITPSSPVVAGAGSGAATLMLDDGSGRLPVARVDGALPGAASTVTIRVSNAGTSAAPLALVPRTVLDTPGIHGGLLSSRLVVRVEDADGRERASVPLASAGELALGAVPPRQSRTWRLALVWPDGGVPPGPTTGDNAFMGSTVEAALEIVERP